MIGRMSIFAKLKGLVGGNKGKVKGGIDKAADLAGSKLGADKAAKIDGVADKAKSAVDKL
jgi:hypothetical protein